jgi:hypothetical protein
LLTILYLVTNFWILIPEHTLHDLHQGKQEIMYVQNEDWLTLILLTWRIWWAPNNANKWQMGFNRVFKVLILCTFRAVDNELVYKSWYFELITHSSETSNLERSTVFYFNCYSSLFKDTFKITLHNFSLFAHASV